MNVVLAQESPFTTKSNIKSKYYLNDIRHVIECTDANFRTNVRMSSIRPALDS